MSDKLNVIVLIGGNGSNLQRLIDLSLENNLKINISAVISHHPTAYGLKRAERALIPALCVDHTAFPTRSAFETSLSQTIDEFSPDLIVLAGFMRILSADFIAPYAGKMINIHPSRLPLFKGLHTHASVLASQQTEHGATIHFVTADLDGGPIIAQSRIEVSAKDTEESLKERVQATEYELCPQVIQWFQEKRLCLKQDRVYLNEQLLPPGGVQL